MNRFSILSVASGLQNVELKKIIFTGYDSVQDVLQYEIDAA
jgi:hypothetical protein